MQAVMEVNVSISERFRGAKLLTVALGFLPGALWERLFRALWVVEVVEVRTPASRSRPPLGTARGEP